MRSRSNKILFTLWLSTVLLSGAAFANAQFNLSPSIGEEVNLRLSPEFPGPNESVEIFLEGPSYTLSRAEISWTLDGRIERSGTGERSFSFTTGPLGSISTIVVDVSPQSDRSFSQRLVIRPSEVDIVWEGLTYVPNFYRGRRLYSQESWINIQAVPHFVRSDGTRLVANNLIYSWKLNGSPLETHSGYGRNGLSIKGSLFENEERIELTVESADGQFKHIRSLTINPVSPRIVFYQRHPLYGLLLNRALPERFDLEGDEITIVAAPYSLGFLREQRLPLELTWLINSNPAVSLPGEPNVITLRKEGGLKGLANISLQARHPENIAQSNVENFIISFRD